ncbi:transketolase [Paenibacillus sp. N1-5-1-14]|uniref:transketolase n=1 Tax=Paenibacillus radicibacter TaxID=2972488 RepID=UPI0021596AA9|nr:transketolase [Paenibacillus radicibacter]MCR8642716.1 transketolase [Paenibacillus radicibacter]
MNSVITQSINSIRTLGIDAIEKSKSGHPGIVMGAAPMAYTLWTKHLQVNPQAPQWFNRDRFVLSAGHGSMLLYGLLHLSGFDLSIDDIKNFRQDGSKTPGHPEFGHTAGVDATTGPLGQGVAMAVGMALAEKHLAAKYNRNSLAVVDHYTYAICGDGDLMEGVSAEACSFAGHQKLGKLIVMYDSNDICLDGDLSEAYSENTRQRFDAYGWQTILVEDGTDVAALNAAIAEAKLDTDRPTLIEVKTIIGHGSPGKAGTNSVHGAPLGAAEAELTKAAYNWTHAPFEVPQEVYTHYKETVADRGQAAMEAWDRLIGQYEAAHPELYKELMMAINSELPADTFDALPTHEAGYQQATRNSSQDAINAIAKNLSYFLGGSADLAHSNMTMIKGEGLLTPAESANRNIQYGVREFAMAAIMNGMAVHKGLRVFGSTFFVFSDYLKAAMRLSSLMNVPVTYVLTHDSIAVGEDGPTHEPVEQLVALRALPNMNVIRPADARETQGAWKLAVSSSKTPTSIVLTRQPLDVMATSSLELVEKGAYIIGAEKERLDAILIATGSEVNLAMKAQEALLVEGIDARVISMPSQELFEAQTAEYKESVLPRACRARLAIEMGATLGWHKYVGLDGDVLGIDTFGASAPAGVLLKQYGFTVENVVSKVKALV